MSKEDIFKKYRKHPIAFVEEICGTKFTIIQKLSIYLCVKFELLKEWIRHTLRLEAKETVKFVNGSELTCVKPSGKISRGKVRKLHFDNLE